MRFYQDAVHYSLRETFDLDFLHDYGEAFCAFDQNDSGNLSFGVRDARGRRFFVKIAGARTLAMSESTTPDAAIAALRRAAPVYEALRHPALIRLVEARALPCGYALVFEWAEGECLHAHWSFDEFPKYTHERSAFYRYLRLPRAELLDSLDVLFAFHVFVAEKGYVAIDFYDGSVLYDFATRTTTVCDIDFYAPAPYTNRMGRMWGSSRFLSPEETQRGASIDEITNVFTMGATAFVFLGGETERGYDRWRAGEALYAVARRAVNPRRQERYPTLRAFYEDWQRARRQEENHADR